MKLQIESTPEIITIKRGAMSAMVRVWAGTDEHGVPVHALIAAVSPQTMDQAINDRFAIELQALETAASPIDLRFIL